MPSLQIELNNGIVGVVTGTNQTLWFQAQSGGGYQPMFAFKNTLQLNVTTGIYTTTDSTGKAMTFDLTGRFQTVTTPAGQVATAQYSSGLLSSLATQTSPGVYTGYFYLYVTNSAGFQQLQSVTYKVNNVPVRRCNYTYYPTGATGGTLGDLQTATVQFYSSTGGGTWTTISTSYYRYYLAGDANGFVSGLKYSLGPQAYANMVAAGYTNPLIATDAQLAGFADYYFQYQNISNTSQGVTYPGGMVTQEVTDGGKYTYSFSYISSPGYWMQYYPPGNNAWVNKTIETLPDGNQNIVYTNVQGQVMLKVFVAGGNSWYTYFYYDGYGRGVMRAESSAVASYSETMAGLVTLKASSGLIYNFNYYDFSAPTPGLLQSKSVQQGSAGTAVLLSALTYMPRSVNGQSVYPVATETVYQASGGLQAAMTTYTYTWQGSTLQISQRTITPPIIPTSQNGSGTAVSRQEVYDAYGNLTWAMDERGFIVYTLYDATTGALVQRIDDVQTSGMSGVPSGWTTPTGGGLNLVTDYLFDSLGRITQELGPSHTISLAGVATVIRRAKWTVYQDNLLQVWEGSGYATGSAGSYVYTLTNPVSLTYFDLASRIVDQIQAARTSPSGALSASDTFPQTSWSRWTLSVYDANNNLASRSVYFLIPSSGFGTLGTNYNQSVFGYDVDGRQNKQETPGGTITRTVYSAQGWVVSTWMGTNDNGATDSDPTGGGAPGNNMVEVVLNQYDGGAASGGDGNLTQVTLYQDGSTTRVTGYGYDYRDRRISKTPPVGASETYMLDNLNRLVQVDRTNPTGSILVARSATNYDNLGRVYQRIVYGVNQSTGIVGNALTSNTWYDPSGNVIKSQPAGASLFDKTLYDGAGRPTLVYSAYNLSASGYPYPVNVTADTVMQQIEITYDAASNITAQTTRERFHNTSGTGALGLTSGPSPLARLSHVGYWPDQLGRQAAVADYGTNKAAHWDQPSVIPAASDTVLVTLTAYDNAGNAFQVTDPLGAVAQSTFDQAGRLTKLISNYVSGGTGPDQNQEIDYTYNADNRILTLIAVNSATGNQTTRFVYGTTLPASNVASNDLLVQKIYPANSGTNDELNYTYNRLGEMKGATDSNGTAHTFIYDALGRLLHDCVTTLGSGVDGTVLRVSRAYEVRGMLQGVTSYNNATVGGGTVVNDVLMDYDSFGQLSNDYQSDSGAVNISTTLQVQYAYASGSANTVRRTSITYPNSRVIAYDYGTSGGMNDALSRISSIDDTTAGTILATFTYLGLDTRVQLTYTQPNSQLTFIGVPGGDGGDQYVGLDRFGRLVDQRWISSGGVDIERVQYGYDRGSNRLWRKNTVAEGLNAKKDELYTNDGLQQLKQLQQGTLNSSNTGITGTPGAEEDFTYDPIGNWANYLVKFAGTTTLNQPRTHNVDNEITAVSGSGTLVGYDHAGNMTTTPQPASWSSAFTLIWDAWNRLMQVKSGSTVVAKYAYDGLTRRVTKIIGTTTRQYFYSDQWKVLEERLSTAPTVVERQFVWRGCDEDKLILRDTPSAATTRLYAMDDGKNVTAVSDASGNVLERYGYSGFGAPVFMTSSFGALSGSAYTWETLFCGYRFDSETGFYQVRYRYLHAELGRWLSRDPIGDDSQFDLHQSRPGGLSLDDYPRILERIFVYMYLSNNSITHVDPYGLAQVCCRLIGKGLLDIFADHCELVYKDSKGQTLRCGYNLEGDDAPPRIGPDRTPDPSSQFTHCYDAGDIDSCLQKECNQCQSDPPTAGQNDGSQYGPFSNNSNNWVNRRLSGCGSGLQIDVPGGKGATNNGNPVNPVPRE